MKFKTLQVITFSLFSFMTLSQSISPYYPSQISKGNSLYETQFTFIDLNFVNVKVENFVNIKMNLTLNSPTYNLKEGKGSITYTFIDKIAINKEPRQLNLKYNVFPFENEFVIESVEISGNNDLVTSFYIKFWNTKLDFDNNQKNVIVENNYLQDHNTYLNSDGKSVIKIKNSTIFDREKFISDFKLKRESENLRIIHDEKLKNEKIEKEILIKKEQKEKEALIELERVKTHKEEIILLDIKKGKEFKPDVDLSEKLNLDIEVFLKDKEIGNYQLKIVSISEFNKVIENKITIEKFQKSQFNNLIKQTPIGIFVN